MRRISLKYKKIFFVIMLANIISCGVKGNPVMLSQTQNDAAALRNLRTVISGSAIEIQCDLYGKNSRMNYIAIEKSEVVSIGNECKDCQRGFERIAQVTIKEMNQNHKGYISYTDEKVAKGKTYDYRLLLCDEFNNCFQHAVTKIEYK